MNTQNTQTNATHKVFAKEIAMDLATKVVHKSWPLVTPADTPRTLTLATGTSDPLFTRNADGSISGKLVDEIHAKFTALTAERDALRAALLKFTDTAEMQQGGGDSMLKIQFNGPALTAARAALNHRKQ